MTQLPPDCPLGEMHGSASGFTNEAGVRCCDFCGHPVDEEPAMTQLSDEVVGWRPMRPAPEPKFWVSGHGYQVLTSEWELRRAGWSEDRIQKAKGDIPVDEG